MKQLLMPILLVLSLSACSNNDSKTDASGTFEAEETIISSETSGTLKSFTVVEGQLLQPEQIVGYVDSTQLYLKKQQLLAQIKAINSKQPDIPVQLAALQEQLTTAQKERRRISNLVKADAATPKQLDDISAQVEVLTRQIAAQRSSLSMTSGTLQQETMPLNVQIEQTNDQLKKCVIVNPVAGSVLTRYMKENEIVVQGKPLYRIADLRTLTLRAYITNDQLAQFKLNDMVKVYTDDGKNAGKEHTGTIVWVSDKAEFTPKTIQTKDERANMVYAIKVSVKNDGFIKPGMYGELKFK